ncbi:putative ribonuclease H-like domain-containing protein [Tanacetum coccineum]
MEPKKVTQALDDESWVEAMQEELLQFKLLNVWTLVDLPHGKKAIGTKWVFRNKRDQRGIVVRNKARLVAQGYRQEEGVDYDEVFAPVARIEAIRLFLAFASFMGFTVYQMDVKSAFLYGTIEEEVYVNQPPGFVDPEFPNRVYKVEKALYGLHQAPRAWYETLSTYLLENGFRRGTIDKTLFIKKIKNDILLVQVYVDDIIFGSTKESLSTEFEQLMHKRFQMSSMGELTFFLGLQVEQRKDGIFLSQDKYVYEHLRSLAFLVHDWIIDVLNIFQARHYVCCVCLIKISAISVSDMLCSIDKNLQLEVLWLQNQLLDYGYNFMKTKIHVDNESAICVVKNPIYHSKTKHIEIRHHFIRDSYEKKLIEMVKIHTDYNVADLLTKAFDVTRISIIDCLLSSEVLFEGRLMMSIMHSTTASTNVNGEVKLTASIDGQDNTITEASLRRHLKLENNGGIISLPNTEIFEQLTLMGGYSGEDIPLFPSMITAPETSPSRITSSPYLSPHHTPLVKRVKKLEKQVKTGKARRRTKIVLLEHEAVKEDSSKQGRSLIEELDMDADISLVPPHDAEIQEKISDDTEVLLEEEETTELIEEPTELVEDQGSGEKGEQEVTTADTALNTASVPISTSVKPGV